MPWHIERGGGTCGPNAWAVIKDTDGSTAGCHPSEQAAKDHFAALYTSERFSPTGFPSAEQRRRAWVRLRDYRADPAVQSRRMAARDGALIVVLLRADLLARREPPC